MELDDLSRTLDRMARAWGKQEGWCFFPWIDGDAATRDDRRRSFHEGKAWRWPEDKANIVEHLVGHEKDDAYWCPSLFEEPRRQMELAMDEHCLWADLDEVDPRSIEDFPPSMAWETSPDRYQALWLLLPGTGDLMGASWRGRENHRLTEHLGADPGGWDTTQLLRIPGWRNHKPEYRHSGGPDGRGWGVEGAPGKLLWAKRRLYQPDDFQDLPDIGAGIVQLETALMDQAQGVDAAEAWGKVRLKVSNGVRELVAAREISGDRSETMWRIERDLADAGLTVPEIVAVMRETEWNKFAGRNDELRQLTLEAAKAVEARPAKVTKSLEVEREGKGKPTPLAELVRGVKQPSWLIRRVWTEGAVGFIAGQPKSFKSWFALDMAVSVATGAPFLGAFQVIRPGPVLYIQEEDSLPTLKRRWDRVRPERMGDKVELSDGLIEGEAKITWTGGKDERGDPAVDAFVGEGVTLSDEGWQAWLDETLDRGWNGGEDQYRMVVLDPLLMMMGEIEENKAADVMGKILGPLRTLARKHECAVVIVHHMRKSGSDQSGGKGQRERGGQLMLGSVAYHAWADEALYLRRGRGNLIVADWESKSGTPSEIEVGGLMRPGWRPEAVRIRDASDGPEKARRGNATLDALADLDTGDGVTMGAIIALAKVSRPSAHNSLNRALSQGKVRKKGIRWFWTNKQAL